MSGGGPVETHNGYSPSLAALSRAVQHTVEIACGFSEVREGFLHHHLSVVVVCAVGVTAFEDISNKIIPV